MKKYLLLSLLLLPPYILPMHVPPRKPKLTVADKYFLLKIVENVKKKYPKKNSEDLKQLYTNLKILTLASKRN